MSRASVAERAGLSVILARRLFGSLVGRVTTNPVVSWLASFGKPDRLVIAPQDLRTTDATRASEAPLCPIIPGSQGPAKM